MHYKAMKSGIVKNGYTSKIGLHCAYIEDIIICTDYSQLPECNILAMKLLDRYCLLVKGIQHEVTVRI